MKRPFVTLCIFLFGGILCAHILEYSISLSFVFYTLIISLFIFLFTEKGFVISILIITSILGCYAYNRSIIGDTLVTAAPKDVMINARILNEGSFEKGFNEYEVEIIDLYLEDSNKNIKVNKKSQLKIYESTTNGAELLIDDIIEIRNSNITKVLERTSENELNSYELFLKSKGIEYILEADMESIKINSTSNYRKNKFKQKSYKIKIYIEDFLDSTLDSENSDIAKSIVFGNQGYLSEKKLDIFSKTGTAHIMAVSGLHVGLIVIIIDNALKLIKVGRNRRLCLVILILIFYSYMVYFPVSIVRAGSMYALYVMAYFLNRRYDSINALFFIAFMLLIYRPLSIFSISFQLSFVATLSILLLSPIINKKLSKKIGFLAPLLAITLSAQIGTLPIMAYYFNQISVISLVTNLLIVPLLGPILSILFIGISVGLISFELGFFINQISNALLSYVNWISTKCAIIPYGSFEVNQIKFKYIACYYILIGAIYFLYKRKESKNLKEELMITYEL